MCNGYSFCVWVDGRETSHGLMRDMAVTSHSSSHVCEAS